MSDAIGVYEAIGWMASQKVFILGGAIRKTLEQPWGRSFVINVGHHVELLIDSARLDECDRGLEAGDYAVLTVGMSGTSLKRMAAEIYPRRDHNQGMLEFPEGVPSAS